MDLQINDKRKNTRKNLIYGINIVKEISTMKRTNRVLNKTAK